MMVSDDHGDTFRSIAVPNTNSSVFGPGISLQGQECQVAQAPDGTLVLNMRTAGDKLGERGVRQLSYSTSDGETWSAPRWWTPTGSPFSGGASEASILSIPRTQTLAFLAPLNNKPFSWSRSNLTLMISEDFGHSYEFRGTVDAGTGGYSSMAWVNDSIAIFYESHAYGAITLKTTTVGVESRTANTFQAVSMAAPGLSSEAGT